MKKLIGLLALITVLSSCKKLFDRDPEIITIEGVLYGEDGETPVGEGYQLELYALRQLSGDDVIAEATTDANGYYKLEYERGDGSTIMDITLDDWTILLQEVPSGENLVRDLCLCNFGWVEVALSNNINLASNDTLYFGIGVGGFSEPDIAFTQQNRNTTVTLKVEKDAFYGLSTRRYFYGIGKANYNYAWSGNSTPSGPPAPTEKSGWGTHNVNLAPYRTKLLLDF